MKKNVQKGGKGSGKNAKSGGDIRAERRTIKESMLKLIEHRCPQTQLLLRSTGPVGS